MIDVTQLSPDEVKRLQTPARSSTPCGCGECRRARAQARHMDDAENAVAARLLANDLALTVSAGKLVDLLNKPDLAEAERAEFDRVNEGDRFDGLS